MNFNDTSRETEHETTAQQENSLHCYAIFIDVANCCIVPSNLQIDAVPKWKLCIPTPSQQSNYDASRETEHETAAQQESSFHCYGIFIDVANCCLVPSNLQIDTVPKWKLCIPTPSQQSNYTVIPQENYEEQSPIEETTI